MECGGDFPKRANFYTFVALKIAQSTLSKKESHQIYLSFFLLNTPVEPEHLLDTPWRGNRASSSIMHKSVISSIDHQVLPCTCCQIYISLQ